MNKPDLLDLALHEASLAIARAYVGAYNTSKTDICTLDDLLTAYRNVRRHIQADSSGKRYGAEVAHKAMQGLA